MKALVSPKELAGALGVSESSIKRWVDEGKIVAHRTAGGHRRIELAAAVRFLRDFQQKLVKPVLLGLPEQLSERSGGEPEWAADWPAEVGDQLHRLLESGASAASRSLLVQLYLEGYTPAEIFDGPLRLAMSRIGHLWTRGEAGIFVEHRATEISLHAVQQLRALMPENPEGPLAIGGAPSPDSSQLPTLMAAITLAEVGFRAVNLGPDLPLAVLGGAVADLKPALVWVSFSHASDPRVTEQELDLLYHQIEIAGGALAIGGPSAPPCLGRPWRRFLRGDTLAELVAFARGLGLIAVG